MQSWLSHLTLALAFLILPGHAEHVWVEGESGEGRNIQANGWYRAVRAQDLSGGDWLATYGGDKAAMVRYEFSVPASDDYFLWVRANPIRARLHVAVGKLDTWIEVPITKSHQDNVNIAEDGKPDMRFLAWTKVGPISLTEGNSELRFRMSSKNGNHGGIDCFCLTTDKTWKPEKALKPSDSKTWPAPVLSDANLRKWGDFIRPSAKDLAWRGVRWHQHLDEAAEEAKSLERPILLWAMNGHPCGET